VAAGGGTVDVCTVAVIVRVGAVAIVRGAIVVVIVAMIVIGVSVLVGVDDPVEVLVQMAMRRRVVVRLVGHRPAFARQFGRSAV
jgi:hypothetical protein